jgi:hypothetical protein
MTVSRVKGAKKVVCAIQRVRYALKEYMSVVQVSFVSQATSKAMPPGKKVLIVEFRRRLTLSSHMAEPFVCTAR